MPSEGSDLLQAMVVGFMIHDLLEPPGDVGLCKHLHPAAQAEPSRLRQINSCTKTQHHEVGPALSLSGLQADPQAQLRAATPAAPFAC